MDLSNDLIKAVIPLILLHAGLMIYSLWIIGTKGKTKILPRPAWVVLIICVNVFGSLAFLLLGRNYEED